MAFKVLISPRAQKEIEIAIEYYALHSSDAPSNFISALQEIYGILAINPFFRIRYKSVRAVLLKRFPHYLFFVINENQKTVRVLSCFHGRRNPTTRP